MSDKKAITLLDVPDRAFRTDCLLEAVLDGSVPRGINVVKSMAEKQKLIPHMTLAEFNEAFDIKGSVARFMATGQVGRNGLGDIVKKESPLCDLPDMIADLIRPNLSTAAQPSGLVRGREDRPGRIAAVGHGADYVVPQDEDGDQ